MDIGQVEDANRPRAGRQYGYLDPTQPERIDLIQPGVRQAAGADRPDAE